jgi:hypothetical protein
MKDTIEITAQEQIGGKIYTRAILVSKLQVESAVAGPEEFKWQIYKKAHRELQEFKKEQRIK